MRFRQSIFTMALLVGLGAPALGQQTIPTYRTEAGAAVGTLTANRTQIPGQMPPGAYTHQVSTTANFQAAGATITVTVSTNGLTYAAPAGCTRISDGASSCSSTTLNEKFAFSGMYVSWRVSQSGLTGSGAEIAVFYGGSSSVAGGGGGGGITTDCSEPGGVLFDPLGTGAEAKCSADLLFTEATRTLGVQTISVAGSASTPDLYLTSELLSDGFDISSAAGTSRLRVSTGSTPWIGCSTDYGCTLGDAAANRIDRIYSRGLTMVTGSVTSIVITAPAPNTQVGVLQVTYSATSELVIGNQVGCGVSPYFYQGFVCLTGQLKKPSGAHIATGTFENLTADPNSNTNQYAHAILFDTFYGYNDDRDLAGLWVYQQTGSLGRNIGVKVDNDGGTAGASNTGSNFGLVIDVKDGSDYSGGLHALSVGTTHPSPIHQGVVGFALNGVLNNAGYFALTDGTTSNITQSSVIQIETGTTAKPFMIGTRNSNNGSPVITWADSGDLTINAPSGFASSLLTLKVNGSTIISVPTTVGTAGYFLRANGDGTTQFSSTNAPLLVGTSLTFTGPNGSAVCTGTCTVNVPVPVQGSQYCVMNDNNVATVITLAALGSGAMYQNQAGTAYGTAGTGTLVSLGIVGTRVCLLGLDSTHYLMTASQGVWTAS